MSKMLASLVFKAINEKIPPSFALKNDKIGYFGPKNSRREFSSKKSPKGIFVSKNPQKIEINKIQIVLDILPEHDFSEPNTLVICHHPPLFKPDYPVFVIHSNWDIVQGGANDALAECLEVKVLEVFDKKTGIGRICSLDMQFEEFIEKVSNLPTNYINIVNNPQKKIKKIAIVSGFGLNNLEYLYLAKKNNVDVFLSGDMNHQSALVAKQLNLCVIDATHYATEMPGLIKLGKLIAELGIETEIIHDKVPWKTSQIKDL